MPILYGLCWAKAKLHSHALKMCSKSADLLAQMQLKMFDGGSL